jgi:hypothetical protein
MPVLGPFLALAVAAGAWSTQPRPVNPDAKTLAEFGERVEKYAALHRKLASTLPALPEQAEPEHIQQHQLALARLITGARANAKPGHIFTRSTRAIFRRLIAAVLRGPDGRHAVAEIFDENTRLVPLRVNGPYPDALPLSSVPFTLLQALPRLPEEIEYRFVGRRLILFDRDAGIIVDYMTNALP